MACDVLIFINCNSQCSDPDPLDPSVFGPPGSGSRFFRKQAINGEKTNFLLFCFIMTLSLKNYINVHSKRNRHKNFRKFNFIFGILKITGEKRRSRICIRVRYSNVRIRWSGSIPKCYGSGTLELVNARPEHGILLFSLFMQFCSLQRITE